MPITGPVFRYHLLREQLSQQKRPRNTLARLEKHAIPEQILEKIALLFKDGQFGSAEVLAAVYYDLYRHQDKAGLLNRVRQVRMISNQAAQALVATSQLLSDIFIYQRHISLGYQDWPYFILVELSFTDKVAGALIKLANRQNDESLDILIAALIENWKTPLNSASLPEKTLIDEPMYTQLEKVKKLFCLIEKELLLIAGEVVLFKDWRVHEVLGYAGFSEFAKLELGFSVNLVDIFCTVAEYPNATFGDLLQLVTKGYIATAKTQLKVDR
jgi:hypothetical protein